MVASSVCEAAETKALTTEGVGNTRHLNRHSTQMFTEGRSFSGNERDKLWLSTGKTMVDMSPFSGADSKNDGRAVISADLDDDGDVDLFVHELQRERHAMYRNGLLPGSKHGFVKVRLRATEGQWEAIGSTVRATTTFDTPLVTAQILSRGAGIASSQAPELVFGLGDHPAATLDVRWPNGKVESFGKVDAGSRVLLVQGTGKPEPFAAKPRPLPDPSPAGLKLRIGDPVPNLALLTKDGTALAVDLAEMAGGETLYLNLWATYCGPCIAELPDLEVLHKIEGQNVLAISVDLPESRERAAGLLKRAGVTYDGYYLPPANPDTGEPALANIIDLERLPIPTTLVIDAEGKLQRVIRGPVPKSSQR